MATWVRWSERAAVSTVNSAAHVHDENELDEARDTSSVISGNDSFHERCVHRCCVMVVMGHVALCTVLSHHAAAMLRATDSQPRVK